MVAGARRRTPGAADAERGNRLQREADRCAVGEEMEFLNREMSIEVLGEFLERGRVVSGTLDLAERVETRCHRGLGQQLAGDDGPLMGRGAVGAP